MKKLKLRELIMPRFSALKPNSNGVASPFKCNVTLYYGCPIRKCNNSTCNIRAAFQVAEPLPLDLHRCSSCTWCTGCASTTVPCFHTFLSCVHRSQQVLEGWTLPLHNKTALRLNTDESIKRRHSCRSYLQPKDVNNPSMSVQKTRLSARVKFKLS